MLERWLPRRLEANHDLTTLRARGLIPTISEKGKPAPLGVTNRWVVERTNSWQAKLAHKKKL
jgi:hypothetical protein